MKIIRFIVALPIAIPLIIIGFLLSKIYAPLAYIGILGLLALGLEANVG